MKRRKSEWPLKVKAGSAVVRIYRTEKENGYVSYPVVYYKGRERKMRFFQDVEEAKEQARRIAEGIAEGQHPGMEWNANQRLAIQRALDTLVPVGISIDLAISEYVEARRQLGQTGMGLIEAARQYARTHVQVVRKSVAEAVDELIAQIETERQNSRQRTKEGWAKLLRAHLRGKLARDFQCDVADLSSASLGPWLTGLKGSERTRSNVRDCVAHFLKWAKGRNYLPQETDPLANVPRFSKRRLGDISLYTPDEMKRLLAAADQSVLPFLLIAGFAGLRHAEIARLDWRDIDLEEGFIEVKAENAKTQIRRIVTLKPNLCAWLKTIRRREGKVVSFANMSKQLSRVAAATGNAAEGVKALAWKRNALRHTYISARVAECGDVPRVADEAGNSPEVIRTNYLKRIRPAVAEAWFGIMPPTSPAPIITEPAELAVAA